MRGYSAMGGKNSTKFLLVLGVLVIIMALAATLVATMLPRSGKAPNSDTPSTSGCQDATKESQFTIEYTADEQFSPDCVKIKSGTTLVYKNNSSANLEVGADPHPAHTGNREVSDGHFDLPVAPGESASVVMKKKGEFGFHNHANASAKATVRVE